MINKGMMSSNTPEWSTPQDTFDTLNALFNFTVDVCATKENAKLQKYYTKEQDGLAQSWDNELVWCNPPYGREIGKWVKKANEAKGGVVVMLLPSRTDTKYFHEYIYKKLYVEIYFIKGRLKFGGCKNSAPFPSMIVIFRSKTP